MAHLDNERLLRLMAARVVSILPPTEREAARVLDLAQGLLTGFVDGNHPERFESASRSNAPSVSGGTPDTSP